MDAKLLVVAVVCLSLTGCAKKQEAEQVPISPADLNQTMSTQTELTLMSGSESAKTVDTLSKLTGSPAKVSGAAAISAGDAAGTMPELSNRVPTEEEIQRALQAANLYTGKIDGDIGPKTKRAIKAFQEQNGLTADGKVGAKTWAKLQVYLNQAAETLVSTSSDDQE